MTAIYIYSHSIASIVPSYCVCVCVFMFVCAVIHTTSNGKTQSPTILQCQLLTLYTKPKSRIRFLDWQWRFKNIQLNPKLKQLKNKQRFGSFFISSTSPCTIVTLAIHFLIHFVNMLDLCVCVINRNVFDSMI